jgi:enamine deaminase RidA (YjgF/YER057c/UK114 family)
VSIEERLQELGIELPPPPKPVASYEPVVVAGGLAFVAGQGALVDGAILHPGHVGDDVTIEEAQEAARRCALQVLSALREALGSLEHIRRIANVTVYVSSASGFTSQPQVANGASELFIEVLGDAGRHARAAVGVAELPFGIPGEIEFVAEVV